MVYANDSKSFVARREGSSPSSGTSIFYKGVPLVLVMQVRYLQIIIMIATI